MRALVKMLCLFVLCPVLLAAGVQTLTIDSQLGTSIEDCFDRIAIGSQLPFNAIYRNISELTTRECEQLCKQDKQCQVYDYGVGAKGNATCDLSNIGEKELLDNLPRHPDFDVYVRRIQCEQGPPSPLLPEFNDPEGPEHRPVFRPDDESKRPLADDVASDLRPFEAQTRPVRPYSNHQHDERPDVYDGRPDFDRPPSYGVHRPQSIPYPEKPRPRPKPDPYDVLQFQNPRPHEGYWRPPAYDDHRPRPDPQYPPSPADDIPDIYGPKPIRPYPIEDKPVYQYIYRPHKKPYKPLEDDFGYGSPPKPNYPKPENDYPKPVENYPSKPYVSGTPYKPEKPVYNPIKPEKPSYSYNDQYASSYGQGQYEDNSIHVEIHDPKPQRPLTSKPIYGNYGQFHGSQNSYSQTSQYTGTITEIDGYGQNHNQPYGYRPQKPIYDAPSYGGSYSGYLSDGYGSQKPGKPQYPYVKPIYSDTSYGSHNDQSYGSLISNRPYNNQPSYDYTSKPSYNQPNNDRPDYVKPLYDKPMPSHGSSYGSNQGYDSYRPSYNTNRPSYGSIQPSNDEPIYESNRPNYNTKPSYASNQGSYGGNQNTYGDNKPSYGANKPLYGGNEPTYGGSKPSYGDNQPSYGDNKPSYGDNLPPYGGNKPSFDDNRPSYGGNKPSYGGNKPLYDDNQPSYGGNKPSYGGNQQSYGGNQSSYGTEEEDDKGYAKPSKKPNQTDGYNIKPVYEYDLDKPANVPSYIVRPDGGIVTSRPMTVGDYGRPMGRPVYGDYEARRPGYGLRPVDFKGA